MVLSGLWLFTLTALAIELTPGPNMAYLALIAASDGRRAGFAAVAGVALGLLGLGALAGFGLSALIAGQPLAYEALRYGGAGYLLWLAFEGWRAAEGEAVEHAALGSRLGLYFRRGLLTNLLNPKAALFFIAVLPSFLPAAAGARDVAVLTLIYVAVATVIHAAVVALAGALQPFFADPQRGLWLKRGLALGLAAVAIWFFVSAASA